MVVAIILVVSKPAEPEIDPRSFEEIFWDSETAEEAISEFQKKIDAIADPEQKAKLYTERANFLFLNFSTENIFTNQILNDALKAEEIFPSNDTTMFHNTMYLYFSSSQEDINE